MPAPSDGLSARLVVGAPHDLRGAVARSYLSDGRCVGWNGPVPAGRRVALDAELADREPPPALLGAFGARDFWERWTRAECAAKLLDVPIVIWLRRYGLDEVPEGTPDITTHRPAALDPDLVVSIGLGVTVAGEARPRLAAPARGQGY